MRNRFDQFCKLALQALLSSAGQVETDREVSPEAQHIDVWFMPDPPRVHALRSLGLLGRLAAHPCAFEAFHCTPRPEELDLCHLKHATLCHLLLQARPDMLPAQWILSSGRPTSGLHGYGCKRASGWPPGIYLAPPRVRLGIVVIRELPVVRETLLLRLLGAGAVLQRAIRELKSLPLDAPERHVVLPLLVRFRLEVPADPDQRTAEDREFLMSTQHIMDMWERQIREQGIRQGMERALATARRSLLRLYEARFGSAPLAVRERIQATSDPDLLDCWIDLAAVGTREEVDQVLGSG